MAGPLPLPVPNGVSLKKSTHIPGGSLDFDVSAQPGSDVLAAALATDTAFPRRKIELGEISIRSQAEKAIAMDGGRGTVTFSGKADAYAGAAVVDTQADVIALLVRDHVNDQIAEGLHLEPAADRRYVVL